MREKMATQAAVGTPDPDDDVYVFPASFAQRRLWLLDQLEPGDAAYNLPIAVRFGGRLDLVALAASLEEVTRRHESLRTVFRLVEDQPCQVVLPASPKILTVVDWHGIAGRERQARELLSAAAKAPFDLARGPLARAVLVRLSEQESLLLLVLHHIISDAWSTSLLVSEMAALYTACCGGRPSPLPELPIQYADFTLWQLDWLKGERLAEQLGYWRRQLAGIDVLQLPVDQPAAPRPQRRGGRVRLKLPRGLTEALQDLSRRHNATLFMTLLAAFQALLFRWTGQEDFAVGAPIANRHRRELARLIGYFANTLVLRADLSGDPSIAELVLRVRETSLDAYAHQDISFELLVKELVGERDLSHSPLFQVAFVLQDAPAEAILSPGLRLTPLPIEQGTAKFDLTLALTENPSGLAGALEYDRDLFARSTVERLAVQLECLLKSAVLRPEARLSSIELVPEEQRHQLVHEWGEARSAAFAAVSLSRWFEQRVSGSPDAVAVIFAGQTLTYGELNARANRLARHLRRLGVRTEILVAVCLARSLDLVVAVLAILKAGGAYVPLDPDYPAERLRFILKDALGAMSPAILLTQQELADRLGDLDPLAVEIVALDTACQAIEGESRDDLAESPGSAHLAYVIYTSGSTGKPKGALISHCNVLRLFATTSSWLMSGDRDVWTLFHSYAFDFSVWELWGALLHGGRLVVVPYWVSRSAEAFSQLLHDEQVTVLNQTPSAFRSLLQAQAPGGFSSSLRLVILGGEAVDCAALSAWFEPAADGRLVNMYGITETTVHVTYRPLLAGDVRQTHRSPIGVAIPDLYIYLLDRAGRLAPAGVAGEIHVGGPGLARGYLGRPELTAARFVPDPLSGETGARLYRTGDVARHLPDGGLEYLGRIDHQVKIRGFRIEVGEIEGALAQHPAVREAAVLATSHESGEKRLCAYVAGRSGAFRQEDLRQFLRTKLPDYMVPALFVELEALPRLPMGKVDRRALAQIAPSQQVQESAKVPARGPLEAQLAAIWSEVLRVPTPGVGDNFFELGGDSILSIQVASRARRQGLYLTPRQLFEHPTIAELAREIVWDEAPDELGASHGPVPLTPIQHWFFAQQLPHPEHFNQAVLLAARCPLRAPVVGAVVSHLLSTHDALRLRFRWQEETGWGQVIEEPSAVAAPWGEVDLSELPALYRRRALEAAAARVQASLDLVAGPLLRFVVVRGGQELGDRLLIVIHHLAVDGVSWRILIEDFDLLYRKLAAGEIPRLPARTTSFKQWSEHLLARARGPEAAAQAAAWRGRLSGEPLPLPADVSLADPGVGAVDTVVVALAAESTHALLREAPRAYRTEINDLLLSALVEAFAPWTGSRRLRLDLEGHGRDLPGSELDLARSVGWFTAIYPVELDLSGIESPGERIKAVKEQLRAVPDRGVTFGMLRFLATEEVRAGLAALPRSEVLFNYFGQLDQALEQGSLFTPARESAGPSRHPGQPRSYRLEINSGVGGGQLWARFSYGAGSFSRTVIESLANRFLAALRELIRHCLEPGAGGVTPADFPLAGASQAVLDRLAARGPVVDLYPLSPMQLGMLFHTLEAPDSGVYVEQMTLRLLHVDLAALEKTWQGLVDRHSTLRTAFLWRETERPLQVVYSRVEIPWHRQDARALSGAARRLQVAAYLREDRRRGFDPVEAPLLRLALFDHGEEGHLLVWTFHHLLLDGWSLPLVMGDLATLYAAASRGEAARLSPVRPYRDYIAWLERQDLAAAEQFWRRELAGFTAPTTLLIDRAGASPAGVAQSSAASLKTLLSPPLTVALHEQARRHHLTTNSLVQGAWALLLGSFSREREVLFGAVTSGRSAPLSGIDETVGLFINTLPVRLALDPTAEVLGWLAHLQERQVAMRQFEHTPLVQIQGWSEIPRGQPLLESVLIFENYPVAEGVRERAAQSLGIAQFELLEQAHFPLALIARPGARLALEIAYQVNRFAAVDVQRMLELLIVLLDELSLVANQRLADLPALTPAERHQVLAEWNDKASVPQPDLCFHQLFEAQVFSHPKAIAVVCGEASLTYRDLDQRANQLAGRLRQLGVGPESRVGLFVAPSLELLPAILGILKVGGAYVPFDPAAPRERLAHLIGAALGGQAAPVLLTEAELESRLPELPGGARVLVLDAVGEGEALPAGEPFAAARSFPDQLLYVIYTSGSTGAGKGVAVTHRGIVNFVRGLGAALEIGPGDRMLLFAPISFDASALQMLVPLARGAALVIHKNPREFANYGVLAFCERHKVTVLDLPAALWRQWVDDVAARRVPLPTCVRAFLTGGESVPVAKLETWAQLTPHPVDFLSSYGPTEATVTATIFQCGNREALFDQGANLPMGRPLPNVSACLLDGQLRPVPRGVPGELFLGGEGLARGYLGQPGWTAEAFVPDPRGGHPGSRLYRTGDLARHLPDGNLEFLGRTDYQVKVRGFRVELAEIEAALTRHPAVREAVVVLREDQPGDRRLVAYIAPALDASVPVPGVRDLRGFLAEQLPAHMIPSLFVTLEALPVLPSGKVNRGALPAPERGRLEGAGDSAAPQTAVEELLAGIWEEVLGVSRVGLDDNFFELGGDSILSIQVSSRAHQKGLALNPSEIFAHPTVAELARTAQAALPLSTEPESDSGEVPLSPIQSWFFELGIAEPHHFNQALLFSAAERLDLRALALALGAVCATHDALRLRFRRGSGGWIQSLAPKAPRSPLAVIDLGALPASLRSGALARAAAGLQTSLDLSHGPLFRTALFRWGPGGRDRFLWIIHHLAVDGVSWRPLLEELETAYRAVAAGEPPKLRAPTTSFASWARRLGEHARSAAIRSEIDHWRSVASAEAPALPFEGEPVRQPDAAASVQVALSPAATESLLKTVPAVYHTQINDLLLTALAQALAPWTGSTRLRVELEGHGREPLFAGVDLSRTVGWLTTQFPVLVDPGPDLDPAVALSRVREQLRQVPGRGIGYGLLRYSSGDPEIERMLCAAPRAEVGFNYLGQLDRGLVRSPLFEPAGEPVGSLVSPLASRPHPLEVNAAIKGGRLAATLSFRTGRHRRSSIEHLAARFAAALEAIAAAAEGEAARGRVRPEFPLAGLRPAELEQLLGALGAPIEDLYPASPLQQGMLFHTVDSPDSGVYVGQLVLTLDAELEEAAFALAWQQLVEQHAILRTAFCWQQVERPLQVVYASPPIPWEHRDFRGLDRAEQRGRLAAFLAEDRRRGFDLTVAPLLRLALLRLDAARSVFVWTSHHLLLDGWSTPLLLRELLVRYEAARKGEEPATRPPRSYRDYIEWLEQQDMTAAESFWRRSLEGFQSPTPLGMGRPAGTEAVTEVELAHGTAIAHLPPSVIEELSRLARSEQLTLSTLFHGAWALLLNRYSGEEDVVFGSVTSGRSAPLAGIETMIGLFINTLPARVEVAAGAAIPPWLRALQAHQAEMRRHEHYPLSRIQAWSQVPRGVPLFESILDFASYPIDESVEKAAQTLDIAVLDVVEQTSYPLVVSVLPGRQLGLKVAYDARRFEAAAVARLLGHLKVLLAALPADRGRPLGALPLLTAPEEQQIVAEWNEAMAGPEAPLPVLHRLVEAQVERAPDGVAVEIEGRSLTYAELNSRANQLARFLLAAGARAGEPIGVAADRSLEMVVALLGILKAGGAFLPLDPSYPEERLHLMLAEACAGGAPPILLTQELLADRFARWVRRLRLDADWSQVAAEESGNLDLPAWPESLAYVIYTSGSTGAPKGAMNSHRGISNRLLFLQQAQPLLPADRVLQKTPMGFDVSVWELFWPLMTGARLVLARPEGHKEQAYLAELIASREITILHFVPSMLQAFLETPGIERCRSLRRVVCSGEALPRELVKRFFAVLGQVALHNLYGPTEAAIEVSCHTCQPVETGPVPIGRPITNLALYVLDPELRAVPVGVPGELYIGGVGVARGYYRRPDLTAERFVPHPVRGQSGQRLYRTGDLARLLPHGEIEYLGRTDHQIKLRGVRIELGEIETVLSGHPKVREAVVGLRRDRPGEGYLVAYVVPAPGADIEGQELRVFLDKLLPEAMVPSLFVVMAALPLLPNGKVDRQRLPAPDRQRPDAARSAPRNPTERALAAIWSEVLRQEQVGIEDNFFELGGDSILSLQIASRAARAGIRLTPRQIFTHPTIVALAAVAQTAAAAPGRTAEASGPFPLTPIQLWFLSQELVHPEHFNQAVFLEVGQGAAAGRRPALLRRALGQLLEQHEALSLRFAPPEPGRDGWLQIALPAGERLLPWTTIDLARLPGARRRGALEASAAALQTSLDLAAGPLLRAAFFPLGEESPDRLLLVLHHLVVDGVSWRILLEDLATAYRQLALGQSVELPPRTTSYRRWAERLVQHGGEARVAEQGRYWLERLSRPVARLPLDGMALGNSARSLSFVTVSLDPEETRALLQEAPRAYRTQINDLLLAALAEALAAWTGSRRLLFDLEGHGREELFPEIDLTRTVGWFTALFPVVIDLEGQRSPAAVLQGVKEQLRAIPERGLPYGLLRYLGTGEVAQALRALPAAEVLFNYLGQLDSAVAREGPFRLAAERVGPARHPEHARSYLLEINSDIRSGSLRLTLSYSANRHLRSTIERVAAHLLAALRALVAHCASVEAAQFTPADFPIARLDSAALERLTKGGGGEIADLYPATPVQQGMLFHCLAAPDSGVYVGQVTFMAGRELDEVALASAWSEVIARHSVLRTDFVWHDLDRPLQRVRRSVPLPLKKLDWSGLPSRERTARWARRLAEDRTGGFDLATAPLLRLTLIDSGEEGYRFIWTYHHAILDGWSMPLLLRELFALYLAGRRGEQPVLPPVFPYRDYVAWLEQQDAQAAAGFWRRELAGFIAGAAAGDRLGAEERRQEALHLPCEAHLTAAATAALRAYARGHSLTLNTLVQGAWALLLRRYRSADDLVFGVVTSGRSAAVPGIESMVGLFLNTLPSRVKAAAEERLLPWLTRLQERQVEMRQHEHTPLPAILGWSEVARGRPLFDSILVVENYPVDQSVREQAGESLRVKEVSAFEQTNYRLTLAVALGTRLGLRLSYEPGSCDALSARRMLEHCAAFLEAMPAMSATRDPSLGELPMLTAAERQQILVEWNDTAWPNPEGCIHHLIEAQVARTPDAVAVDCQGRQLTYAGLDAPAERLARRLRQLGVSANVPVGICAERSPELVVGLLAILKAAGAYVPIDPSYPSERLGFLVADALGPLAAPVLVCQPHLLTLVAGATAPLANRLRVLTLGGDAGEDGVAGGEGPSPILPEDLAYVIYTSGSTGRPKGAMNSHRAVLNRLLWGQAAYGLTAEDRVLQKTPVSFDVSVWELFWPLATGTRLILAPPGEHRDPVALAHLIAAHGITVAHFVPSMLQVFLEQEDLSQCRSLRRVLTSGEALPRQVERRFFARLPAELHNLYGPTEAAVEVTFHACAAEREERSVPIGRPIANLAIQLHDLDGQPVPIGVAGELLIGGAGLARGYLGRPDLTAERFIPSAGEESGRRLYRTGDLARFLPSGEIEYLGRIDHQVKIRGFRIEPAEIEAALAQHPALQAVAVVAQQGGAGDVRLVAYGVARGAAPRQEELRPFLQDRLPEFMVPAAFILVDALPLLPSGKIDRRELASRREAVATGGESSGHLPRTPAEELLAEIFAEVLDHPVGIDDDFFALGGHSLLATQVISRVRGSLGVELPLRTIFAAPTVRELATVVNGAMQGGALAAAPPLVALPRPAALPLSFAQQRLWFLHQMEPASSAYTIAVALRLTGPLDPLALAASLGEVVARHEVLRTTFALDERTGTPLQQIARRPARPPLRQVDLEALPGAVRQREAERLAAAAARQPFDLARAPLVRGELLRLGRDEQVVVLTLHHIVADGWSMGLLVGELCRYYPELAAGRAVERRPLPVQYADFALWQRGWLAGEALDAELAAWRQRLAGAPPVLALPADRPRPERSGHLGASRPFRLEAASTAAFAELGRRQRTTLFMVLLAAWKILLYRWTEESDLVVGVPVANRHRPELEGLIGLFVNTLALRTDLFGDPSLRDLSLRVRESVLWAHAHQDLPFEKLVEELAPERHRSHTPIFQVLFNFEKAPPSLTLPGVAVAPFGRTETAAQFDLTLSLHHGQGLAGVLAYNPERFDRSTIDRLAGHLGALLAAAAVAPDERLSALSLLSQEERQQLLEWRQAPGGDSAALWQSPLGGPLLPDLFAAQVSRSPEAAALVATAAEPWETLSYAELAKRAGRLAHRLQALGIGPEVPVAVGLPGSAELVVALWATLLSGGVFLPLDPAHPIERLALIVEEARPRVLLTGSGLLGELQERTGVPAIFLDAGTPSEAAPPAGIAAAAGGQPEPPATLLPENLAYLIYTSGSTGRPKGVAVSHAALARHCHSVAEAYGLGPGCRVLQFASPVFDVALEQSLPGLVCGATIVLRGRDLWEPEELLGRVERLGLAVINLPTAYWLRWLRSLDRAVQAPPALRLVLVGGEELPRDGVDLWRQMPLAQVPLWNVYGPTEAVVTATFHAVPRQAPAAVSPTARPVPIGRPFGGRSAQLLDAASTLAPLGVPGELHLGGLVARGYFGQADATAAAFVPDSFGPPGSRLYRTGDLARYRADGELEFLGRRDAQVKVRGFRIELAEIENRLLADPAILTAAVKAHGESLVAYLVPRSAPLEVAALRQRLAQHLPSYMVPAAFVVLPELPLTATGKVDRQALPEPRLAAEGGAAHAVAPRAPLEEMLAAIWVEVLGHGSVGMHDDFFALGGHSLLATQVISRIRRVLGVDVSLRHLFEAPTVAQLAAAIQHDFRRAQGAPGAEPPPLVPSAPEERRRAPLSFAQQRLWFLDQLEPGSAAYNIPLAVRLSGRLDIPALAHALSQVVQRHQVLRAVFPEEKGEPVQVVTERPLNLPVLDLRALGRGALARARALALADAHRPFHLGQGPLFRPLLLCLAEDDFALLATMHHIVSDGWSLNLLWREVAAYYRGFRSGVLQPLPELELQYADYARWQRRFLAGEVLLQEMEFWRRQLAGVPALLELPTDRPRPAVRRSAGATRALALPREVVVGLRQLAFSQGATLFMVLLAGLQALLGRLAGQDDVAVGVPVAGRDRLEIEGLIGLFLNTLVLRGRLAGEPSVAELIGRTRGEVLEAYAHQGIPFEKLVDELTQERSLAHTPLFQVMFVLQNAAAPGQSLALPELRVAPLKLSGSTAKFDLNLFLAETPSGLAGAFEYNRHLFDATMVDRLIGQLGSLLAGMAAAPASRATELPLVRAAERWQIVAEWNDGERSFGRETCLHELFEQQVERAPEAPAVVGADGELLSYRRLSERAHQLAHRLQQAGARRGEMVAIYLSRSPEMVVALLGVLSTGAAYVPLDPSYPAARIAWILRALDVRQIVTETAKLPLLGEIRRETGLASAVCLDRPAPEGDGGAEGWRIWGRDELDLFPVTRPEAASAAGDLAYVIFTSGTTGTPKGVMVQHRPVVNLIEWVNRAFAVGRGDRLLFLTSLCFDLSVYDVFGILASGGSLRVAAEDEVRDPEKLLRLLLVEPITFWDSAPAALQQLVPFLPALRDGGPLPGRGNLRLVFLSGDWIPIDLAGQVRRIFPRAEVIGLGGATEAAVWSNFHRIDTIDPAWVSIPYGRPIQNARYHVLDRDLAPSTIGVAGDLYIGGGCLSVGYANDPELTAGKYLPDPFAASWGEAGARLYRTGDRARHWPDGTIEFLGRNDHQVKIRGFRIELGEIETVLASHETVCEAVVVARRAHDGDCFLAGYVVPEPGRDPSAGELRDFLRLHLPEYMVPAAIVTLAALPLTLSGKLDRRALPDPELQPSGGGERILPRTEVEQALAAIWTELLGVREVGIRDDFFALGGHSLVATRVVSRIRESLGVQLPVRELFAQPSIESLATRVEEALLARADGADIDELLDLLERMEPEEVNG
jgi:amino acid adenylation domain-containing protein/non-ribosomal peptide synthase protein (TIGR01720 family)